MAFTGGRQMNGWAIVAYFKALTDYLETESGTPVRLVMFLFG